MDELTFLCVPAIHLCEGVVTAQDGVLPAGHGERLEYHGTTRGHGLELSEKRPVPAHHFGVAYEAREAEEEVGADLEVLDGVDVLHLWDVRASVEQLGAFVPLVDDRSLGTAGQYQVRLRRDLHVLHVSVPVPGVERLVRVEPIAVPLIDGGGACFGAVGDDKKGFSIDTERLHVIWFADLEDVNALEFDEFVGRDVALVNVRATEELSHNYEELIVNHQWFTDHCGCT